MAVSLSFTPFIVTGDIDCCVCKDTLKEGKVVAHEGGDQHPMHRKCLKNWIKINPSCPACRRKGRKIISELLPNRFPFFNENVTPYLPTSLAGLVNRVNRIDMGSFFSIEPREITNYELWDAASVILISIVGLSILQYNLGGTDIYDKTIALAGLGVIGSCFTNAVVSNPKGLLEQSPVPTALSIALGFEVPSSIAHVATMVLKQGITLPNVVRIVSVGAGVIYSANVIVRATKRIWNFLKETGVSISMGINRDGFYFSYRG